MKVLICDDEYATRFMTKSYLDMLGLETVEASNGKEALEIMQKEDIDLIIIDYSMPGMTGLEVLKEINGKIPSISLTSEGFTAETEEELKKYASDYLVKPVNQSVLVETIEKVTGKKIKDE